ncbi:hypothetical protein LCGC14_1520040, partial [marine sediment metagenome]
MPMMDSRSMVIRCTDLMRFWLPRNEKFREWYALIQMIDDLAQPNMESFVGNDPRAAYNLVLHMLDTKIPHRVHPDFLDRSMIADAADVSNFFEKKVWTDIQDRYRRRGRQGWNRDLIGFMLATGWYSVFAMISNDGTRAIAEIWNPATVFQNWDFDLFELAHVWKASAPEINGMARRARWEIGHVRAGGTVYDYWYLDDGGGVHNTTMIGNTLVKPDTWEMKFDQIPVFTSPVGGLPDTGYLIRKGADQNTWKADIGQASIATNANIYKQWNKWWTYSLQLLRDTAQPRWKEKSASGKQIIKPEDVFKRGAIFRMGQNDDIEPIQMPAIPVEIRASQLDMEAMLQRGGPSWAMFGNIQQQLTTYVMSQISSAA